MCNVMWIGLGCVSWDVQCNVHWVVLCQLGVQCYVDWGGLSQLGCAVLCGLDWVVSVGIYTVVWIG